MDELSSKRRDNFLNKNKDKVSSILNFIQNKEKTKESITYNQLKTLKDIQLLKEYLNKYCTDSTLLLTDLKGNVTVIHRSKDTELLLSTVVELVQDSHGEFEFFIELLAYPKPLGFRNKSKTMYLINYDKGTIKC